MKRMMFFVVLVLGLPSFSAMARTPSADASATGISRSFNPAISVNTLFYAMSSSEDNPLWPGMGLEHGMHLQEASVEMTSNVDVYMNSKVVLAGTEEGGVEIEEAYVSTLQLPVPVSIKAGKMLNTFGRHNLYHLHHMAFAEPPMILSQVFGPDLNELSVEASYLVPVPWYMDLTGGVLNGGNEYLFDGDEQDDYAYLVHLDNVWGLTDELTLRLGGSFLTGEKGLYCPDEDKTSVAAGIDEIISEVWGTDLHLKWRPLERGRYRSFTLQGEYVEARLNIDGERTDPLYGYFIQALAKFKLKYWLQARYGFFNRPEELHLFFPEPLGADFVMSDELDGERYSFAAAYVPTEFSAYRIQYNVIRIGDDYEYQVAAQMNFTIGSHHDHEHDH